LGTARLNISTLSIATSFFAASLTYMRSPYYAVFYSANDLVLIIMWVIASREDKGCIPMIFCFVMFLANDMYGFVNWRRMERVQSKR
jgi:hypothetical protein